MASTCVELNNSGVDEEAGISAYMTNSFHYDLFVKQLKDDKQAVTLYYRLGDLSHTEKEVILPKGKVYLQIKADKDYYNFYYSTDNKKYNYLGRMDVKFISSETAGGFTGIYFGLYAAAKNNPNGYADFEWFDYTY